MKRKLNYPISTIESLHTSMVHVNSYVNCVVVNEPAITWGYRKLKNELLPKDCIPVLDNGLTYLLNFDGEKLWPINYTPDDNQDKTPQDCFEAQCWDDLERIIRLLSSTVEKIKLGVFIALAVCLVIVLFLISAMAMGA